MAHEKHASHYNSSAQVKIPQLFFQHMKDTV